MVVGPSEVDGAALPEGLDEARDELVVGRLPEATAWEDTADTGEIPGRLSGDVGEAQGRPVGEV
jgi:hypothetical protein